MSDIGAGAALVFMAEQEYHSERSKQARAEEAAAAKRRRTERRQQALNLLGGECQECGSTNQLRFHRKKVNGRAHRQETRLGASDWTLKVSAGEAGKELIILCDLCHKALHQRLIEAASN